MWHEAQRLVRAAYTEHKPVMGSSTDIYPYHAAAIAAAKLVAIRKIITEWPDTILDIHAWDDMGEAQVREAQMRAIEFVLDMAEELIV